MTDDTPRPASVLAGLAGRRVPGGCDDCDADQTVTQNGANLYRLTVHHDATCPWHHAWLRKHKRGKR